MTAHRAYRILMIAGGTLLAAGLACSAPGAGQGVTLPPAATPVLVDATPEGQVPATEIATEAPTGGQASGPCTPPMPDPSIPDGTSWLVYCSEAYGFSFRYPAGGVPPEGGAGHGFIYLPITAGTNLVEKYLTVTTTSSAATCQSPNSEGHEPGTIPSETAAFNGINFVRQSSGEGAAGNVYEWTGYSYLNGTLCLSLTFILHSSDPGAYATPPATFDKAAESAVFEQIMTTFTWPTP